MWVLIYWVCISASCTSENVPGFSSRETCEAAVATLEGKSAILHNQRVSAVCVNADISYFE